MATGNDEVKHIEEIKHWKKVTFVVRGSPSQGLDTTESVDAKKKRNHNDVKKEKDDSLESKFGSAAYQIDVKALLNRFMGMETSEKVHEGGVNLALETDEPSCSTSEQSKSLLCIAPEEDELLKKQAAKLKQKNKKLDRKLRKYIARCMELYDDNKLIMGELEQVCQPCEIQMLKAKDPYNNLNTHQEMELPKNLE